MNSYLTLAALSLMGSMPAAAQGTGGIAERLILIGKVAEGGKRYGDLLTSTGYRTSGIAANVAAGVRLTAVPGITPRWWWPTANSSRSGKG